MIVNETKVAQQDLCTIHSQKKKKSSRYTRKQQKLKNICFMTVK